MGLRKIYSKLARRFTIRLIISGLFFSITSHVFAQQVTQILYPTSHNERISAISLSDNGNLIATTDRSAEIKIWTSKGLLIRNLDALQSEIESIDISPSGNYLAAGDYDGFIKIWDLKTGEQNLIFQAHKGDVWKVRYGSSDNFIVSTGSDKKVVVLDTQTGKVKTSFSTNTGGWDIDLHKNKILMAAGHVYLGDLNTNTIIRSFEHKKYSVGVVKFDKQGNTFATLQAGNRLLNIWDTTSGELIKEIEIDYDLGNADKIDIKFSDDGKKLYTLINGVFSSWDINKGVEIYKTDSKEFINKKAAINPSANTIITTSDYGRPGFHIYSYSETDIPTLKHNSQTENITAEQLIFSEGIGVTDNNELIFSSLGYAERFLYWPNNKRLNVYLNKGETVSDVNNKDISIEELFDKSKQSSSRKDHQYVARLYSYANGVSYIDVRDPSKDGTLSVSDPIYKFKSHEGKIEGVEPIKNGAEFISWDHNSMFHWKGENGTIIKKFRLNEESISKVSFSFDHSLVAVSSREGSISIFDIDSGRQVHSFYHGGKKFMGNGVVGLYFTKVNRLLVSGNEFGQIKLWDLENGKELLSIYTDIYVDNSTKKVKKNDWIAITPDGRFDGTKGAMENISVIQGLDVLPIDSFFETYYTPRIISTGYEWRRASKPCSKFRRRFQLASGSGSFISRCREYYIKTTNNCNR